MNNLNSIFLTDGYKTGHHVQYPLNTTLVFSNFTPRSDKYAPEVCRDKGVVVFGIQLVLQYLKDHFDNNFFFTKERGDSSLVWNAGLNMELKRKAIDPIKKELSMYLNTEYDTTHFEELWDLGYLPLEIRALDEGTICPIKVPMLTINNTLPEFYWLPNFLETILSNLLWKPVTSATIAFAYRQILEKWAIKTNPEAKEFVLWQGHDFSMRGLDSIDATISSGLGHLTSFYGTDSLPPLIGARYYYGETEFVGGSVFATEHSVMCAGSKEDELGTFKRLLETYPSGILSVVSDTWDLWNVITNILPKIKDDILTRDGKLVIRPDSGDPTDILCGRKIPSFSNFSDVEDYFYKNINGNLIFRVNDGVFKVIVHSGNDFKYESYNMIPEDIGVIELLWDLFGGTINEQGYKVLDSHIGAIYGDSITTDRAEEICSRLEKKGFASTNVVLGIGSYTYQYNTRDTFGFAMKATYVEKTYNTGQFAGGMDVTEGYEIFKDPITDSGMKKSARGLLKVVKNDGVLELKDGIEWADIEDNDNELKLVFMNGKLLRQTTLTEIRKRINKLL